MNYRDYDTRLSAYAIVVDEQDRALLALWNEGSQHQWTVPGGGAEAEETPEEAAVRELREETGYQVDLRRLLGVHTFFVPPERRLSNADRGLKVIQVVYDAEITGGELTNEVDGSTDEARWIPVVEIPSLPHVNLVDVAISMWQATR